MPAIAQLTNSCASFKASKHTFTSPSILTFWNISILVKSIAQRIANASPIIESHKIWSFAYALISFPYSSRATTANLVWSSRTSALTFNLITLLGRQAHLALPWGTRVSSAFREARWSWTLNSRQYYAIFSLLSKVSMPALIFQLHQNQIALGTKHSTNKWTSDSSTSPQKWLFVSWDPNLSAKIFLIGSVHDAILHMNLLTLSWSFSFQSFYHNPLLVLRGDSMFAL